eukprot:13192152-Alexandrium_andersonii.AAC.1
MPSGVTARPTLIATLDTQPAQELRSRTGPPGGFPHQAARATRRTLPRYARAEPARVSHHARHPAPGVAKSSTMAGPFHELAVAGCSRRKRAPLSSCAQCNWTANSRRARGAAGPAPQPGPSTGG